jgi:hypothetical protein
LAAITILTVLDEAFQPADGENAMSRFTDWFAMLIVPLFLLTASCESSGDDKTQVRYPSAKAVFDAYREAREKREWGKLFSLLTPQAQKDAVFEDFFSCTMSNSGEAAAIIRKYVDGAEANSEYEQRYKKKHGIDLAKHRAGHETDPKYVPPEHDDQLWRDVVAAHVKDKAEFNAAVAKYFDERDAERHEVEPVMPLGKLEHLVVHDDTATGSAKQTVLPRPGESPLKPGQAPPVYEKPFTFRRVNAGWLLDSL